MRRILTHGAPSIRPLNRKEIDAVNGGFGPGGGPVDVSNCTPLLDHRGGYMCPGRGYVSEEEAWGLGVP